jgi:hypothetical protein
MSFAPVLSAGAETENLNTGRHYLSTPTPAAILFRLVLVIEALHQSPLRLALRFPLLLRVARLRLVKA